MGRRSLQRRYNPLPSPQGFNDTLSAINRSRSRGADIRGLALELVQGVRAATPFHEGGEFAAQVMELATICFLKIVIRAKHGHSAIKAWLTDVRACKMAKLDSVVTWHLQGVLSY